MITVVHADALAWLREQPDCSFDAYLADPPYGLSPDGKARTWDDIAALRDGKSRRGFMGKAWDAGVPGVTFWREVLRVLKPGAPILAFGGTRTYHRMVAALEDAGAEIVDCLSWLYGQGFPKSYDVSKGIDAAAGATREVIGRSPWDARKPNGSAGVSSVGRTSNSAPGGGAVTAPATPDAARWSGYGTALRPSWEPCVLACKPFDGTIAANALKWGVGGLWIDGCRIGTTGGTRGSNYDKTGLFGMGGKATIESIDAGRWAPNVALDEAAAEMLDEQSGELVGRNGGDTGAKEAQGYNRGFARVPTATYRDSGGASRFMYVAKVSRWEREFGCDALPVRSPDAMRDAEEGETTGLASPRAGAARTGEGVRNHHPTLKPIALTQWLATLILPPPREDGTPRRLLNTFGGAGSEAIGAMRAGWDEVVTVEREADYVPALRARVARWSEVPRDMTPDEARSAAERPNPRQGDLFSRSA